MLLLLLSLEDHTETHVLTFGHFNRILDTHRIIIELNREKKVRSRNIETAYTFRIYPSSKFYMLPGEVRGYIQPTISWTQTVARDTVIVADD